MTTGRFLGPWVARWRRTVTDVEGQVQRGVRRAYAGIEGYALAGRNAWLERTARRDRYAERRPTSWNAR